MPTIPWLPPKPSVTSGEVVLMASKLEVKSLLSVPEFFLRSLVVWRQVQKSPGLVGASLKAQPLKRTFWTLSAWESREALGTFNHTDPHGRTVTRLRKVMKGSVFTFWNAEASALPITWDEATRRIAEQEQKQSGQN
jgi:hypothetical protein